MQCKMWQALILISLFFAHTVIAVPLWIHIVNEKEKLQGGIVTADEFGTYWNGELPAGWKAVEYEKMRILEENPEYINLGQILPEKRGGKVFLRVSCHSVKEFFHHNDWSEQKITESLLCLEQLPEIEFREDCRKTTLD